MNKLEKIENVIIFVTVQTIINEGIHTPEELKTIKQDKWEYLDYLVDACDKNKYNLYILTKSDVRYTIEKDKINIVDKFTNTKFSLTSDNVKNTIIFQGQSNAVEYVIYDALFTWFENENYFVINNLQSIKTASDKFLSSSLLSKYNIPQPNYIIVSECDIYDSDGLVKPDFFNYLHTLYEDNINIDNAKDELKYVCKTLRGSLGIGVFIAYESEILSVLQAIFALHKETNIIIQAYKANTGDIRSHVFSFDLKNYEILAAMKRNKIKGDFRSNVSLGATTSKVELTPEQEKIILDTAKASGCHWVGVDLMECINDDETDNVVIEYNSSPGVEGISQQIKRNMFEVIFEKINKNLKNISESINEGGNIDLKGVKTYKGDYFVKNILLFTKSTDEIKNDGTAYVKEITKYNPDVKTYCFINETLNMSVMNDTFMITDEQEQVTLRLENIHDTIIINRGSIVKHETAMNVCRMLEDTGFMVFNPINTCLDANDKYRMKEIFDENKIACPRTIKVTKEDMTDKKQFDKILNKIYKKHDDKSKYVLKIPNGFGGTGVSTCDGSNIFGILQTIFAINPKQEMIVQEFLKCDGGDFRVHVLTTKTGQTIMCAMQRNKLDDDFRSNVSLGASTKKIELSEQQEKLALSVAKASGMPWCAVDIMHLKEKSQDGYEDVVIEFNDSPGLDGISHLIGKNMINVLLDNLKPEDLQ